MQGVYSYDGATGKTGPDAVPVAQEGATGTRQPVLSGPQEIAGGSQGLPA